MEGDAMAGKRQHDLARLLLRGFASRYEDDKEFIWQFRIGAHPPDKDFSLRDVGLSKDFYGKSGPGSLDDFITHKIEPRHADFLSQVREDPAAYALTDKGTIADLVQTFTVRTRNCRDRLAYISGAGMEILQPIFTDTDKARRWLIKEVRRGSPAGDEILTMYVKQTYGVKASESKYFTWSKKGEFARWLHTREAEKLLHQATAGADPPLSAVKGQIPELLKTSHNDNLRQMFQLNTGPESPRYKRYIQMRWTVQITEGEPLILGDVAVLQYKRKTGEFSAAYDGIDGDVVLLPISPDLLVVGVLEDKGPLPSAAKINYHSAALSMYYFVASQHTEREREYQKIVGSMALRIPQML
jgi:hypothetical protein